MKPHDYKLEFECTHNEVEYGALIQALELEKVMNIKSLSIFGDVELVFNQVKSRYGIKKCRLKVYAEKVWDLIDHFQAINVTFIHREKNQKSNFVVVTASMLTLGAPRFPK